MEYALKVDSQRILSFYMGKNTPERKDYIMENLVVTVGGVLAHGHWQGRVPPRPKLLFDGDAEARRTGRACRKLLLCCHARLEQLPCC